MMDSGTSAVLDVVVENKELPSITKSNSSICSSSRNSMIQSPSLESFSTIQDVAELNMDENSDLCIKVDNPQKLLEPLETYITFRITTKAARIEFPENEYCVRRRYNDFMWLRQKLVENHPFCLIPPLPGKHTLIGQLDRYSKEFVMLRMKSLNLFMHRLVQHPILSCNEYLFIFITANSQDFSTYRKQKPIDTKSQVAKVGNTTSTILKKRHLEFDKTKNYLTVLSEKLSSFEKISARIMKERTEFVNELNNFHPIFTVWATSEPEISKVIEGIGHALERISSSQDILLRNYNHLITHPVKDLLSYIDVVQETLKKREYHQQSYENANEELNKKHEQKDKLIALSQSEASAWKQKNCEEQLKKIETHILQLLKKVETNQDNLDCANECLRSDLERWKVEKEECIQRIFLDFVNKQIEYEEAKVNAWERIANEIAAIPSNNNSN